MCQCTVPTLYFLKFKTQIGRCLINYHLLSSIYYLHIILKIEWTNLNNSGIAENVLIYVFW